jgi:hypothetical protein
MDRLRELLEESLSKAIGTLIAAAVLSAIALLRRERVIRLWRRLSRRRSVDTGRTTQPVICPLPDNSQLLERLHITRERVVARVHEKCGLVLSSDVRAMFQELNARRMSRGLIPYYSGPRFKLAIPPRISDATLELDLIPLDYAYVALMKDEDTDATTKQMIQEKITRAAERLPASLQTEHPQINARSYSILGVMVCLITSDRLTLLRLRGRSVLTGRGQWDISVSGHPTTEDFGNGQLDLASTIRRETENEIGSIRGDPRRIVFTGLHRNKVSEDIDLLAFWPIDDSAEQVKQLITKKHTDQTTRIFKTTERARESYVWDTDNLLVEFDGSVILQALREKGVTLNVFVPEALVCLELALMARSCTTLSFSSS